MAWLQITLQTPKNKAESYSDYLMQSGAVSVTFQDAEDKPLFEPAPGKMPLWEQITLVGLFERDIDLITLKQFLKNQIDSTVFDTLHIAPLEEKNWTDAWREQFHPMRFGKNLWICPSHREIPDPTATNVLLDPGMAFGTGSHPTTYLCLEWLDAHPPHNAMVIDYGCGSGILGIAALKLGAAFVYAVDYDPQAILSTQRNAERNGFQENKILSVSPDEFNITPNHKADLILANILANPLMELAPAFAEYLRPNGVIVLSGILDNQVELITQHYQPWFTVLEVATKEEWARVILRNC